MHHFHACLTRVSRFLILISGNLKSLDSKSGITSESILITIFGIGLVHHCSLPLEREFGSNDFADVQYLQTLPLTRVGISLIPQRKKS